MEIKMERMLDDLASIVSYTKTPDYGCTRFSYSDEDKKVRSYLISQMKQLNLSIKTDAIGNIRAKYREEIKKPSIMIGSHIDTVKNGGKFDGLAGVLAGLEIIRVLEEKQSEINRPIELIVFAEEEGSNFGITMLGSKVFTGKYNLEQLKSIKNEDGDSVYEVAKSFGLNIENVKNDVLKKEEICSMIELHIEQGPVLEEQKKSIGIVQAIAGMKTYKVTLEGDSNHAGTTPMNIRCDPLVGASSIISYIPETAQELAGPTTVATVGKIICKPNMPNVIPQKVQFYVDVRDVEARGIDIVSDELAKKVNAVSEKHFLKSTIEMIGSSESVKLSSRVIHSIETTSKELDSNFMRMNSGAVHDAAMLTEMADVGMIFIPSVGGKSHCPEEYTNEEDVKEGCDLLLNVVERLARKG